MSPLQSTGSSKSLITLLSAVLGHKLGWMQPRLYLFSTGDDGCLCIFDIKKTGPCKRDKACLSEMA